MRNVYDGLLSEDARAQVWRFLNEPGWETGWKSNPRTDQHGFLHKHFAGSRESDHRGALQDDCEFELNSIYRHFNGYDNPLWKFWKNILSQTVLRGHTLVRCYANAYPYGSDGMLHTDSKDPRSFTAIYYPHDRWSPNWGGETVFYNKEETDVVFVAYPRPNRLVVFPGTVPHRAAGVSRICPVMRITLIFKTELRGQ